MVSGARVALLRATLEAHPEGLGFNELYNLVKDRISKQTFAKLLKKMVEEGLVTKRLEVKRGQKQSYISTREGIRFLLDVIFLQDLAVEIGSVAQGVCEVYERRKEHFSATELHLLHYYVKRVAELPVLLLLRAQQVALTYRERAPRLLLEYAWGDHVDELLEWTTRIDSIRQKLEERHPDLGRDERVREERELEEYRESIRTLSGLSDYGRGKERMDTVDGTCLTIDKLEWLESAISDLDPVPFMRDLDATACAVYVKMKDESNEAMARLLPLISKWNRLFSDEALDELKGRVNSYIIDLKTFSTSEELLGRLSTLQEEIRTAEEKLRDLRALSGML
jgi:DNA-binding PadR family transcriptional regulator